MDPRDQYRQQAANTASPAQLVLMLFDGALAEVDRAEAALGAAGDVPAAHEALTRAQRIVQELFVTLDHERGGDLARHLAELYTFVIAELVRTNLEKDVSILPGVVSVLRPLRDSWEQSCLGAPTPVAVA